MKAMVLTLIAAVALIVVRLIEPNHRYTFGHAHAVDVALVSLILLLGITHVVLGLILWVQWRNWLPSEEAMFGFIAIKALFWLNAATQYQFRGVGIRLDTALLFVLMASTTVLLDWRLFGRYVRGDES